jgi:hypothetical protein
MRRACEKPDSGGEEGDEGGGGVDLENEIVGRAAPMKIVIDWEDSLMQR